MRVGLAIYGSLQTLSGGYLYDQKLVGHLRGSGDEVTVFSLPWRSYPRHLIDNFSSRWLNPLAGAPFDILLQDELNHPSFFLLNRRLRTRVSYPIISIVHHLRYQEQWPFPVLAFYRSVERCYLDSVDGFVFNSQASRRAVEELLGRAGAGVIAHPGGDRLPSAVDEGEIVARANRRGPLKLIFVGNVISRKGLHDMLAALVAVNDEPWELSVVGSLTVDLDYSARIRKAVLTLGLEKKVRLLGSLSDVELASILKGSDIMAMPFSYEGFGIVYLEGMGYGLPAMACRSGGAGEIVKHGENGYLFGPDEKSEFANLLLRLMKDRDELLRLSLAARRHFDTFPTWDRSMARIRDFLIEVSSHAPVVKKE